MCTRFRQAELLFLAFLLGLSEVMAAPIHDFAQEGNLAKVQELIEQGVEIDALNENGMTALALVSTSANIDMMKLLLENGADVNYSSSGKNSGISPLHGAVVSGDPAVAELLISHGAMLDVAILTESGALFSPLEMAAIMDRSEVAEVLISAGADLHSRDQKGATPLQWAAYSGSLATAELLIRRGANVNAANVNGVTPLHEAAKENHPVIAELLVTHGADVNARATGGLTPLHWATMDGPITASHLLDGGADIEARDEDGQTPLHMAAILGNVSVVTLLLDRGANVNARDSKGRTPFSRANGRQVRQLLRDHGGAR